MDYPAEVFDQIQFLFDRNGFNDHQLHCILRFDHGLSEDVLKEAVAASIQAIPLLGTRYVAYGKPHWTSLDARDFSRAFIVMRTGTELEDFAASPVDEALGPQVRVGILNATPFVIALKMNHMVCDAADFKTYLYFLCATYSRMMADRAYRPATVTGDRSIRRVLAQFGLGIKFKSLLMQSHENNLTGGARFPLGNDGELLQPFIVTRKLPREKTAALKDSGRAKGATLNDVVLTSYYRCLFQRLALSPGAELRIPVMVDMRRYIKESAEPQFPTNLSSTVSTQLEYRPGEPFEETLCRVKSVMDQRKSTNLGLNGFIKLNLMYRVLGSRITNRLLRSMLKNPLLCMTNVGVLDRARLSFGGVFPADAFLCGSVKYRPYFQLAMSSYDDEITLSSNLVGSAADRNRIVSFLADIDAELSGWALSERTSPGTELHPEQPVHQ